MHSTQSGHSKGCSISPHFNFSTFDTKQRPTAHYSSFLSKRFTLSQNNVKRYTRKRAAQFIANAKISRYNLSEAEKKSDKTKFTLPSLSHFREIGGSDNYRWKFRAIPFGYSFTKKPVETMPISRGHKQKIAIRPNESQKPVVKNISFSPPD